MKLCLNPEVVSSHITKIDHACVTLSSIINTDLLTIYYSNDSLFQLRACHVSVVTSLRSWTLGNSLTALRNTIHEQHTTEEWLKRQLLYYGDCQQHW